ncbi:hypothetical protein EON81_13340 [bacterium]|nr:MAG: hypothetical protein EON81_13340 [bacterium]
MRSLSFSSIASLATLIVLGGCAGSSDGGFGRQRVTVVGGGEGPVLEHLGQTHSINHTSIGASLDSAQTILLDGDHITKGLLGSMSGLRAAAQRGTPILVVDASEELKEAVAETIGAAGSTGGKSLAIGYVKLRAGGEHDFRVFEISNEPTQATTATVTYQDGEVIKSPVTTKTIPATVVTADAVARLQAAMGSGENVSPLPIPESWVPHFYQEYTRTFGGTPNDSLRGQRDSATVTHCYLGILSQLDPGVYEQYLFEWVQGVSTTGDLAAVGGYDFKDHYGWTQSVLTTSTKFAEETSTRQKITPLPQSNLHRQGDEHYIDCGYAVDVFRPDGEGDFAGGPCSLRDLDMNGWQVSSSKTTPGVNMQYTYWQTTPFDGLAEDYIHAWNANTFTIKQYPGQSIGDKKFYQSAEYIFNPTLTGQVAIYPNLKRRFVEATINARQQVGTSIEFDGGSAWQYRLNFASITPPRS